MDIYQILQTLHVLFATVWVGGHITLLMAYGAELRRGMTNPLLDFEHRYEKIGLPSLIFAAATGVAMLYVGWGKWPMAAYIKMGLFVLLILVALHARLRLIPRLKRGENVGGLLLLHIVTVTAISVGFVVLGSAIRFGLFS
jgi:putative copper export protein